MRKILVICILQLFIGYINAQVVENPVFDRTDMSSFRVVKINLAEDTTYIYCSYSAEADSWANISPETFLYVKKTNKKYPLLRCEGLPFSPQQKSFMSAERCDVLLCFPSIRNMSEFDIIENDSNEAFNIYGIDIFNTYQISYQESDVARFSNMASFYDSAGDTIKALLYKTKEIEATKYVFGVKSEPLIVSLFEVSRMYDRYGFSEKAIEMAKQGCFIQAGLWGTSNWHYALYLSNLAAYNSKIGNYAEAVSLETEVMEICKKTLGTEHPDYATSLSNLALYNSDLGNYSEAIRLETEAMEIRKKALGTEHPDYATSLSNLALYNSDLGNYSEAIRLGTEAMEIRKKSLGTEHPDYAMSLSYLATYNSDLGNYSEAIRLETEAMEIRKKVLGTEHPYYATSLSKLALYNSYIGNYSEAIRLGTEAMEIRKKSLGTEHPDYATSLSNLATYNAHIGSYSEAIRLGTEAMEICKKSLGTEHPDYATSLRNLALYNSSIGNYSEAIRLGTEAMEICKKSLGTEHPNHATSLNNIAMYNSSTGNYSEAIRFGTEAMEIRKKSLGKEHPDYAASLGNFALYNSNLGNYSEAIRLETEAMEILKKVLGTEHPDYATSLSNLATYNSALGNYSEAIRLETEAMEIRKKVLGTEHPNYALSLSNLALYNFYFGNYSEAIRLGTEAMEIRKKSLGTEHPDYATSLSNLASCNSDLGNYSEAIRLGTEAMEIRKKLLGTEHPNYATSLNNLATYNAHIGNYSEAIRLCKEAMEISKKSPGAEHPDYAKLLGNLATYNSALGNYSEALRLGTEAMEICKKSLGTEHPDYATSLNNLAICNSSTSNYSEAIRLSTEAMEIFRKNLGTEHPDYALSLGNLASYYYSICSYENAYRYLSQQIRNSHDYILKNIGELSSNYQKSLWMTKFAYAFFDDFPCLVSRYTNKESISELYNSTCLFAKGILLNTGIEIRKLILNSKDSLLINKYNALSTNLHIYNKLIERPVKERYLNTDSLNSVIQKQEMELSSESKVYGDFTHNLTITWKDVQRNLEKGDIAIEFLDYPLIDSNSTMYVALTLKKDYDAPHMVALFEENQLKTISEDTYYTQTNVYDIVWKPLENELESVRNIYFAPSGELHRIGIEYLPISKTENISEVYSLHRLSSTRQLAITQNGTEGKNTILYGGINYDEKHSTILTDSASAEKSCLRYAFSRTNVDSLSVRSSFEYLEGTKREADMIVEDMKLHRLPYIYYTGIDGTEESFKQLDGTKPKSMHIATHGFYFTEAEAEKSKHSRAKMKLMTDGFQKVDRPIEDRPMTRSGLLFSGCNRAFRHEQIPEGEEDGILTAQEIAMLDLRGLDLVVLSACQTGLGDVISGEGVFGLQRGFKKAGANTILMSLNKVDDEATRILMVEFYRNLMNGKTKRESLQEAQQYLRKVDGGKYDDPKYWASFIMLDGLN